MPRKPEPKITADIPLLAHDSDKALNTILTAQFAEKSVAELREKLDECECPNWTNEELLDKFEAESFHPPYVTVIRKSDGVRGTVLYIDSPRLYFSFEPIKSYDATQ